MRWKSLSHHDLDREYNPSSCLPDGNYRPFVEEYRRVSDEAWEHVASSLTATRSVLRYGEGDAQSIDVAVPTSAAAKPADCPILVFIHGGYWQELSKIDSGFAAQDCIERGWAFAAIDYTLAPAATLDEIVAECRQAIDTLRRQASELGFAQTKIFVAGSSAGAHLVAMLALTSDIAGAVLVSGVFELEPIVGLSINDALGLDLAAAHRNSPLLLSVEDFPPTVLAYGSIETSEFKAQTDHFERHLVIADTPTRSLEIEGRNHFDVILDVAKPGTPLGDAVANLIDTGGIDAGL